MLSVVPVEDAALFGDLLGEERSEIFGERVVDAFAGEERDISDLEEGLDEVVKRVAEFLIRECRL